MQAAEERIAKISAVNRKSSNDIRIGINCSMLDSKPTGVGVYTYNLVNSLSVVYADENTYPLTALTPITEFFNNKIDIIKLPSFLQSSEYGLMAAAGRFVWNTLSYPFWEKKFDVIICPTSHGSFFNNRQVLTIHDLLSLRYNNISRHQRFYFTHMLPVLIKKAKVIVAVSEATKKEIIHYFGCPESKIKVVYNGYNAMQYHPSQTPSDIIFRRYGMENYLLAVGPTYPHKNFSFLIETFGKLDKETRKMHPLLIAGGREQYLDELKSFVRSKNLEDCIKFAGYVPNHLMGSLYREAFALVYPSLYEGFGFPVLEAMACGCPVLASEVSSLPEVCGEAACYFNPSKQKTLLAALRKVISFTDYRSELAAKGLKRAKLFTWEKTAAAYKNIIDTHFSHH
jgi:glycosyltransferase involved in cell wall biosynthesis